VNLKGMKPESFGWISSFFYRLWAEPALAPMHERIAGEPPLERGAMLDVGCGPGRLTRRIAERRPAVRVVGLDASADMIRQARRMPGPPNLEFREGTPATSAVAEEFDMAISVLSFHHWEEPVAELCAVHRALKPGGSLWIYEQDAEASAAEFHADRAPLFGFLRVPAAWQRRLARGHGFTRAEIDSSVRPAVERTLFRALRVAHTGSTFRLELTRDASKSIDTAGDRR
jgi:SAM-dependent methyltransferase